MHNSKTEPNQRHSQNKGSYNGQGFQKKARTNFDDHLELVTTIRKDA